VVTLPQLFRKHGARSLSYGKVFHAGLVEGIIETNMLDDGKSWDEARMFRPTPAGNTARAQTSLEVRSPGAASATWKAATNDQSDGQTAAQSIAAMEKLAGQRWFIGAGFHRPHDPFLVSRKYVALFAVAPCV